MARAGRSHPNRPILARHPTAWDRAVTLPGFETVSEWPGLTVTTPNARLTLPGFETVSEWPALTVTYDQNLTLPGFETVSEWPALTVTVPVQPGEQITGDYQIEFGGVLFGGHGNRYQILAGSVEGWDDLPPLDSGNVARPTRHGSWPGRRIAQERQVSAVIAIDDNNDFTGALADLRRALAVPDDDTETSLAIRTRGETLVAFAAVESRVIPSDRFLQGWAAVAVRWTCSDPRRYAPGRNGVTVPLGVTTLVSNAGDVDTHPLIRIEGPATDPVLTNTTTGRALAFAIALGSGERLEIDTDGGTVTIGGENRMSALTGSSVPVQDFTLPPGDSTLVYTAASGGGEGADVLWFHAYL